MSIYYIPPVNLIGAGCLKEIKEPIKKLNKKKALVVSDNFLKSNKTLEKICDLLEESSIEYTLFTDVKPNPTIKNVEEGLDLLQKEKCDFIISVGGGSPQDCGKAIAVLATNGGKIGDYEGVNKSEKKCLPIVAITTTAGTSAEVTINYVITDEERQVKMIMVDTNTLAEITVNDPELMISKPSNLTAATGMDALTHAVEAVVAKGAYDITNSTALYAIDQIFKYLPRAVKNGNDLEAREQMSYACFLNGIAFSNAGLGNVHAMAHQLGGLYDLPHGICNAILLPIVQEENAKFVPEKFRVIAKTIGMDVINKTDIQCAEFVIEAIKNLSEKVGIPKNLREVGVDLPDFDKLAENAMKDACAGANPVFFNKDKLIELFKKIA